MEEVISPLSNTYRTMKYNPAVYGWWKSRLNLRLSFYNNLFFTYRVLMENLST